MGGPFKPSFGLSGVLGAAAQGESVTSELRLNRGSSSRLRYRP